MLTSRLKRNWNRAEVAGVALTAKFAPGGAARAAAKRLLADRLGRLHGLPQKVGQMLSFSWTEQEASPFRGLQDQGSPLPLAEICQLLEASWNRPWRSVLESISPRAHAASIGQVHAATLQDGRRVAIKVQYPGIRDAIRSDLDLLGWLSLPMGGLSAKGFDMGAYRRIIEAGLEDELDYGVELESQQQLGDLSLQQNGVAIPKIISELSTKNLLVTEWIDHEPVDAVLPKLSVSERQRFGAKIIRFFLKGLLGWGVMQADWHPGNVRCRTSDHGPEWVLFDFGATCRLSPKEREAIRDLLSSPPKSAGAWKCLVDLGFDPTWLSALRGKLEELCSLLFEPFHKSGEFSPRKWRLGERMAELLGEDRWNFRIAAAPGLLPLMRAFHGLFYYLLKLDVEIDFRAVALQVIGKKADKLAEAPCVGIPPSDSKAQFLKIRVQRGGQTTVQLAFPSSAAERLDSLVDEELAARIHSQGIDLLAISQSAPVRQRQVGRLFYLEDGERTLEVFLA